MLYERSKISELFEKNNIRYRQSVSSFVNTHESRPETSYLYVQDFGLIGAVHIKHASYYGLNNFIENFPEINSNIILNKNEYIIHCMISENKYALGKLINKFIEDKSPTNIYFFNLKSESYVKWSRDYLNKLIDLYNK